MNDEQKSFINEETEVCIKELVPYLIAYYDSGKNTEEIFFFEEDE